jgi:hypothetical protein
MPTAHTAPAARFNLNLKLACLAFGAVCAGPLLAATPQSAPQAPSAPKMRAVGNVQPAPSVLLVPREHRAPRRGVNMDAGVPPSGVPTQTMQA